MGLATRVIPTLLCRGRQLFKGEQFNAWRSVGLVAQAVRIHQARGVDELVLLDICASREDRGPDLALVEELSDRLFCPLSVGGGVRSVADVKALLRAGADKVVVGRAARKTPRLIAELSDAVGSQAIVVAIDVDAREHYGLIDRIGRADAHLWAGSFAGLGAGEILLTAVEREGTMQGYDLEVIRRVAKAVPIPVIAHGGCSGYEDMRAAIEAGASAVAAGALFQFTDATPGEAARYLQENGIEARV